MSGFVILGVGIENWTKNWKQTIAYFLSNARENDILSLDRVLESQLEGW